jgi:DNA-binding transcriptional regulator YiaG
MRAEQCYTPADLVAYRAAAEVTVSQAAGLVGRTARNWQQWEAGERVIDPAIVELFLYKAGLLKVKGWRRKWTDTA